jgi:RNA polymerase sigma-70 factor (ECF subfamily)
MNLESFDFAKGNFEGWAKKIMTNTAIDYARSQKDKNKFIELKDGDHYEREVQQNPNNHVEEEVLHLIKNMPAVTQKVFSLHIFKGYSHKEIAELLDIAESTSRWHLGEARKSLKQQANKIY